MNHLQKLCKAFKTCELFNNNLCGKLFSLLESPATFDGSFKVNSVPFFIPHSNTLSCEFNNFNIRLKRYIESIYTDIILK